MLKEGVIKIWQAILDRVFPESCLVCGVNDVFLCQNCLVQAQSLINPSGVWACPSCKQVNIDGGTCIQCTDQTPLDQLVSLTTYKPKSAPGQLIEQLKYAYSQGAIQEITQWLTRGESVLHSIKAIDIIVPIPLHARRQAERGFNQSEIIATTLGQILNKPVKINILKRSKATKQQAKLGKVERQQNVKNAFVCVKSNALKNKNILLVDDVYTTGSTMSAAASVLNKYTNKKARGFTLARGL